MFTTGFWQLRRDGMRDGQLNQKVEWGISDKLQVPGFVHAVNASNSSGATATGMGDLELGGRYTWANVGSPQTHVAAAVDLGFPTGDPRRGLGEAAYTAAPSILASHEFQHPRRRCLQSARILAAADGCPIETVDALAEIDFGEFEGRTYDEIALRYPELYRQWMNHPTEICFPGGESFDGMWTRVTDAASAIRNRHIGQRIGVVTHGGVIRVLLAEAIGIPRSHIFGIAQRYGALNLISYFERSSVIEFLNYSAAPDSVLTTGIGFGAMLQTARK